MSAPAGHSPDSVQKWAPPEFGGTRRGALHGSNERSARGGSRESARVCEIGTGIRPNVMPQVPEVSKASLRGLPRGIAGYL